jgi:sec-independent protein translocase protein TatA
MGGFSIWHLIMLFGIGLLVFGPRRLPELGKGLGEAINGFKKGLNGEEIDVTKREQLKKAEEEKDGNKQG